MVAAIGRGQIFRLPARWPYEEIVDFMVVDIPDGEYGHSIIVLSGNKAGRLVVRLPLESCSAGVHGVSQEWIVKNWSKWVYPDCPVENVYLFGRAEVPTGLMER